MAQNDLKSVLLEDLVGRDPIDTGGFDRDTGRAARFEPVRHVMQVLRECAERTHRHVSTGRVHGSHMHLGSDVDERGVSYVQASQDLGVHVSQLRDWVKKFADDPEHAFPGHGQMKPEQLEIARLKREVTKLKAERDILKKAAAYFAKEST